ncbi:hypothetical protein SAMN04487992_107238 [Cellulophaga baltica]|uniref:Uncharacterized protein n=1 Tax=Cellulophaga baltica TaxID=76594 RepID=A0A1G7IH57_9FLAO|nr:hypothetical protein SAMN04487992_107238 [Cellulophaga baltica]
MMVSIVVLVFSLSIVVAIMAATKNTAKMLKPLKVKVNKR